MQTDLGDGLTLKVIENQYKDGRYRVAILRADTLDAARFGVGTGGSVKDGVLSKEEAKKAFDLLQTEVNPESFDFDDQERIQQLKEAVRSRAI